MRTLILTLTEDQANRLVQMVNDGLHGLAHTYWNPTSTPARYLLVMRPRTARLIEVLHDGIGRDRSALEAVYRAHRMRLLL